MVLNGDPQWVLKDKAYLETNGLTIARQGSELRFAFTGDKRSLRNIQFVFNYKATVGLAAELKAAERRGFSIEQIGGEANRRDAYADAELAALIRRNIYNAIE